VDGLIPVSHPAGGASHQVASPGEGLKQAPVASGTSKTNDLSQSGRSQSVLYLTDTAGVGTSSDNHVRGFASDKPGFRGDPVALMSAALYPDELSPGQKGLSGHKKGSLTGKRPVGKEPEGIPDINMSLSPISNTNLRFPTGTKGDGAKATDDEFEATYLALTGMLNAYEEANKADNPLAFTQTQPPDVLEEDEMMDSAESSTL